MEKFELTFPQKNIWLVENFYESKLINIISGSLIIKKDFEISKAEQTVNKFVEINEGMRLRICVENSIPKQYVSSFAPFEADKINVEGKSEQVIDRIKQEYISTGFDVIEKPLFSYLLIDRGNGVGEIFLKAHHLICDGWSGSKMVMGLAKIYDGILEGKTEFEASPSYLEYIAKEKDYIASEKFAVDEEFWNEYLKGVDTPAQMKLEDITSTRAKRHITRLDDKLNSLILKYCKENRTSPYSIFMSAMAIYLERITSKQETLIATPILNRSNYAEKQMQGMFVSTMPVRFDIDEGKTFKEICAENFKETMTLFRHQRYPYSKIIDNVKKANDDIQQLYDVMISYQNARATFDKQDTYEMTWNFSGNIQNSLEIHVVDLNNEGVLEIDYDYLVDRFEEDEIRYLSKRIETIIEQGLTTDKTIATLEIMSAEEKNKILIDFNNTSRDYPINKTVIDVFEQQVKKFSNKVALTFEQQEMTYAKLNELAERLASLLIMNSVREGDCVAISVDKSFELLISIIAVLKIGAYYLPLELTQTKDKKDYMVRDTNCVIAITDNNEVFNNIKSINVTTLNYEDIIKTEYVRSKKYNETSPVCVLYTSGTTGNPKGALIINKNITKLVLNPDYIEFKSTDTVLQAASTNFDVSLFEFWGPLLNGGTCALLKKQNLLDSNYLERYIKERNITIAWITQALFSQIIDNKIEVFETLHTVFSGGDVMSLKHVNKLREKYKDLRIINCYGPTECTTFTNTFDIEAVRQKRVPLGKAISNTYGYVIDSKFRLLPLYTEGEYIIGGDSVAAGYINNLELTREKFVNDEITNKGVMYKTGDVVRMLDGGIIDFVGRRDNQVKIRGYRIELDEIKNVILSMNNVIDAIVVIRENNGNKRIYAYYVANKEISQEQVIKYIKSKLPKHMVPYGAMQLSKLPLNANGKVDRKNLPEIIKRLSNEAKLTHTERKLLEIIKDNLQLEIDVSSNIFEEGIDSLSVVNLVLLLQDEFGINITTIEIMKLETIRDIAENIDSKILTGEKIVEKKDKITPAQMGIYLEYMKNTENTLYNIPFKIILNKNNIDVLKLVDAINKTIENHRVFFTKFEVANNNVTQVVDTKVEYDIKIIHTNEDEILDIIKNFVQPFDILTGPLANIKIYETEKNIYLLCDFHHLIFDGYSLQLFVNEMAKFYNSEPVEREEKTFLDYMENYVVESDDIGYYKDMLNNKNVTSMPYDINKGDALDYTGKKIIINIDDYIYETVKKVCDKNNITLNTITQATYMLTLSDFIASNDITFGTAFANRINTNYKNTIGMFVKTLPYRYILNYNTSIINYLKDIQEKTLKNYSHSTCAFEDLLKNLDRKNRQPIFNTMFVCQNIVDNTFLGKEKIIIEEIKQPNSKFDITFEILPKDDKLYVTLEYKTKLFFENTIEKFIQKYIEILIYITNNLELQIKNIPNLNIVENTNVLNSEKLERKSNNTETTSLNKTQEIILEKFKEVLEQDELSIDDDFFENGGDSLIAMTLVAKLDTVDIKVTYADIFQYTTTRLLSDYIENKEKSIIYTDISRYDYLKIDELLKREQINDDLDIKGVLLTGVTGFLGAHILEQLIKLEVEKIYCLIRKKNGILPDERLRLTLEYYFGNKYNKYINDRIVVIEEDANKVNIPSNIEEYERISPNISVVVNSAAYVKHFGNKEVFEKVNIEGVNNLIEYCKKYDKRLIQISTISVSGNVFEGGRTLTDKVKPNTIFNENNLYVGQEIENLYVLSKFIAERNILENVSNDELDAIILRVGNLMGRYSDGAFQQNQEDNAFVNRIKTFAELGIIPENIKETPVEFTPVDLAAEAIVKLISKSKRYIYHIYNINHSSIDTVKKVLENNGYQIKFKSKDDVSKIISDIMNYNENIEAISGIIQDLNTNKEINYSSNVRVEETISLKALEKEGFLWKNINDEYLKMFFKAIKLNKGE